MNLLVKQYSDRLVGNFPADDYGCDMYFIELKSRL
jgi:hypothetical protein